VSVGDTVDAGAPLADLAGSVQSLRVVDSPGVDWVVSYGGLSAPLDAEGVATDAALLAAIESGPEYAALDDTASSTLPVTVKLAQARDVAVVPPGAIVAKSPGQGCVVDGDGKSVPVEIVASSLGQTMVATADGGALDSVMVRPDPQVTC
jgi:hypothetical protein